MRVFFRKVLRDKTYNTKIQFFRSIFVGGAAFLVDFLILWILTDHYGVYYLVSAAASFIFGLTTAYLLSIYWVFRDRLLNKPWVEFMVFAFIGLVGLGLNELLLWFLSDILSVHYLLSKIVVTIIIFPANFFARKKFLFK